MRGDAAFGNLASFGGSSVAENAYYVNGFNITNAFNNLAFAQIPFEAIAEQQVKTGGYGAEFGRSTGGVVNLITRRGTNDVLRGWRDCTGRRRRWPARPRTSTSTTATCCEDNSQGRRRNNPASRCGRAAR